MIKVFKSGSFVEGTYLFFCIAFLFTALAPDSKAFEEPDSIKRGREIFARMCSSCHTVSRTGKMAHDMEGMMMEHEMPHDMQHGMEEEKIGHDISGVTKVRNREWLINFIFDPEKMVNAGDPVATRLLKTHKYILMPTIGLTKEEIHDVLNYIESPDETSPSPSLRKDIGLTSRSYLNFHKDINGNKYAPFYEYLDLGLKNLTNGQLNLYSAGWIRYNMKATGSDEREKEELTYMYMDYTPLKNRSLSFTLGRQFVFGGVASEQIDGIHARWEVTPATGFSLYGGTPVETEFDGRKADHIYGGRVFQRIQKKAEAGLSFLREDNNGSHFREEMGIDLWLILADKIEIQGISSYNNITKDWMEHSYDLRFVPSEKLTLTGLFSHINYNDAFFNSTLSVFSPAFLGPHEELTKAGASIDYRLNKTFASVIDLSHYAYKNLGNALYYGIRFKAKLPGISMGASLYRMDGETERLRYTESRFYAAKRLYRFDISLDAMDILYDSPYNGVRNAYFLNGTVSHDFSNSLSASVSIEQSKNPDFSSNTRVILSLVFNKRTSPMVKKYY